MELKELIPSAPTLDRWRLLQVKWLYKCNICIHIYIYNPEVGMLKGNIQATHFFFPSSISDLERVIDTRILNLKNNGRWTWKVYLGDLHPKSFPVKLFWGLQLYNATRAEKTYILYNIYIYILNIFIKLYMLPKIDPQFPPASQNLEKSAFLAVRLLLFTASFQAWMNSAGMLWSCFATCRLKVA